MHSWSDIPTAALFRQVAFLHVSHEFVTLYFKLAVTSFAVCTSKASVWLTLTLMFIVVFLKYT
jgi:hypothetical protein